MKPSISFLVFTHNEGKEYLAPLLNRLHSLKDIDDEIVFVDDYSSNSNTREVLDALTAKGFTVANHHLENDFASHKNFGKSLCKGNIIFQIDADECPHVNLVKTIKEIFLMNEGLEMLRVPRINLVQGLTEEYARSCGWNVNNVGWVNFPDYQDRIFLNVPEIKWEGKVHEKIIGHLKHSELPAVEDYCLIHIKTLERQIKQNELYSTIQR